MVDCIYMFKCHLSRFRFNIRIEKPMRLLLHGYNSRTISKIYEYETRSRAHTNNIISLESNFVHRKQEREEKKHTRTESIYWLDVVDVAAVIVVVVWFERLLAIFIVFGAYGFVHICVMPLFVISYIQPSFYSFSLVLTPFHVLCFLLHSFGWTIPWVAAKYFLRQINFCHECHIITVCNIKDKWLVWWNKFVDQPN